MPETENTAEELERFRQQWQEEVLARSKRASATAKTTISHRPIQQGANGTIDPERTFSPSFNRPLTDTENDVSHGYHEYHEYHDLDDRDEARKLGQTGDKGHPSNRQEPSSALEHYERAVERESEGSLGDSLNHYRKAYRLDAGVDRIYKNKHFPPSSLKSKPAGPKPSSATTTAPDIAHPASDGRPVSTTSDLIASFSSDPVTPAAPPTDASPHSPCPISAVPSELLINILRQAAILDLASFTRLSLVCKRFAYLVATEDQIWKRICLGPTIGFGGMRYKWNCTIAGKPLPMSVGDLDEELSADLSSLVLDPPSTIPEPFSLSVKYPSYRHMLHTRPRLRFNGCYISTVNYIRPGGTTPSQSAWHTPVHIVTYYRYLRFFRDGTCASLLTTSEPGEVVPYLTKENMHTRHAGGLPSAVMNNCLRGRWKLGGDPYGEKPLKDPICEEKEEEGTLHIETEGPDVGSPNPKYIYKMILALKSAGRSPGATKNNKLAWMGYWNYNRLTDDWAEFGLKNDRAFFWSRVKSYGNGE